MTSSGSLASPPSASTQVLKATSALTSLESLGLSFTRSEGKSSREQVHCWSFSCALTIFPVNCPNNLKIPLFLQYLKKKKNPLSKQPRMSQAAEFPSNFLQGLGVALLAPGHLLPGHKHLWFNPSTARMRFVPLSRPSPGPVPVSFPCWRTSKARWPWMLGSAWDMMRSRIKVWH